MEEFSYVGNAEELRLSNSAQLYLLRSFTSIGKTIRMQVRGFSMTPFIRDGDVVEVSEIKNRAPKVGEVVAFTQSGSGRLAIHRIVGYEGKGWLVKGDNNREPDGIINFDQLIGRVIEVKRNGRTIHFGFGCERLIIAWMVKQNLIKIFRKTFSILKRVIAVFFYCLQNFKIYRKLFRKFFRGVSFIEATDKEMKEAISCLNPNNLLESEIRNSDITNYIAKHKNRIIGYVILARYTEVPMKEYRLVSLLVRARYRGLGIGEALTKRFINRSIEDGATKLLLSVDPANVRAVGLFRKMGFESVLHPQLEPRLEEERTHDRRKIIMQKRLNNI